MPQLKPTETVPDAQYALQVTQSSYTSVAESIVPGKDAVSPGV